MRITTVEQMREEVQKQVTEIQRSADCFLSETDNEKFILSVVGYCTKARIKLGLLREDAISFKEEAVQNEKK